VRRQRRRNAAPTQMEQIFTDDVLPLPERGLPTRVIQEQRNYTIKINFILYPHALLYACMPETAIPILRKKLGGKSKESAPIRECICDCLVTIAKLNTQYAKQCKDILNTQLQELDHNTVALNSYLILALVDLQSIESYPIFARVFNSNRADESICADLETIRNTFEMITNSTKSQQQIKKFDPNLFERKVDNILIATPGQLKIAETKLPEVKAVSVSSPTKSKISSKKKKPKIKTSAK